MLECLEDRRLFAAGLGLWVGPNDTIIDFNGGAVRFAPNLHAGSTYLVVCGTDGDDVIRVSPNDNAGTSWFVEINGAHGNFTDPTGSGVRGVELDGYGGDDHLTVNLSDAHSGMILWNDVWGGDGNDTIIGSNRSGHGADNLYGEAGDDFLIARDGDDYLEGGPGADTLIAGAGADKLWGNRYGASPDTADTYSSGEGADDVNGVHEQERGSWVYTLGGGTARYEDNGGSGRLFVEGTTGDDVIRLSVDQDHPDTLRIEVNGDVHTVANADMLGSLQLGLWGDDGDDRIELNLTADQMDAFGVTAYGQAQIFAGHGDDVVVGSGAGDWIRAGYGKDVVYAGGGDDTVDIFYGVDSVIYGQGGDDVMTAGESWTFDPVTRRPLEYRPGTERFYGGDGTDTINGVVEPADPTGPEPGPAPAPDPREPEHSTWDGSLAHLYPIMGPLPEYVSQRLDEATGGDATGDVAVLTVPFNWAALSAASAPALDWSHTAGSADVDAEDDDDDDDVFG